MVELATLLKKKLPVNFTKYFIKFTRKYLCRNFFFNKVAGSTIAYKICETIQEIE